MGKRVLVVDDDQLLASLIKDFLEMGGHDVEICHDAPTAIRHLAGHDFDVLITDLNINGPADGYILAGVSRNLRPDSLILLLTGLPDLEGAWKSIQDSVDRLLLKPIDPFELDKLAGSMERAGRPVPTQLDLGHFIAAHEAGIVEDWYSHVEADPIVAAIAIPRIERLNNLHQILDAIVHRIHHPADPITDEHADAAYEHGRSRRRNGYSIGALLREASHLRQSITRVLSAHFLDLEPRNVMSDLFQMNASIDENMALSLESYLRE